MANTWSGWIIQFLNRANILNTPPNQTFMSEWASHSPGSCHFNPIILSTKVAGSSRCGDTVAGFGRTQNYGTHAEAAHAFSIQMHTAWVKPLLDALNSGNPFQIGDRSKVIAVLKRWGDEGFASWYANANTDGTGGGGGGGGSKSAAAHSGWKHLRRIVNQHMPKALRTSERNTAAALRSISRGRKVRL
jgi:hypothetical protein